MWDLRKLGAILVAASCLPAPAFAEPRVIVIGVDALSLNILDPFMAKGVTPNLKALAEEGTKGDFGSLWPLRTPQVWTTIVTGKYPGQHGIWDHYSSTRYSPPQFRTEEKVRLTTKDRKSKAIWNILDAAGIEVLSVGWINSWPSERLQHGTIAGPPVLLNNKQVSIKGSFWYDTPGQVSPQKLWPQIKPLIVEGPDLTPEQIAPFADPAPDGDPIYDIPYVRKYRNAMKWSIARAVSVERITLHLAERSDPELLLFYFQCTDSLLHRFWIFQKSVEEIEARMVHHGIPHDKAAELKRRFGGVVEACYRDVDARIGRILAATRGPQTLVLVVSDHGFGEAPEPHPKKTEPYGGNHRDLGAIIAAGGGVEKGAALNSPGALDITPTLLHLFGQPVGDDMGGKVLKGLLPRELRADSKISRRKTYEKRAQLKVPYKKGWPSRRDRPLAVDE